MIRRLKSHTRKMLSMFKDIVSRLVHEVCDNLDTANLFSVFQWMNHNNKFTHSPTRVFLDTHSFSKRFLNVKIHHWSLQTGVLEVTYHVYCLLEFFGVSCSYHVTGRLTPVSKFNSQKKTDTRCVGNEICARIGSLFLVPFVYINAIQEPLWWGNEFLFWKWTFLSKKTNGLVTFQ